MPRPRENIVTVSGSEFLAIVVKALAAVSHLPPADRLAMASVLTVMAGAPLHVATDEIAERALAVMPMFCEVLKQSLNGVVYLPGALDKLFQQFYRNTSASEKYRARIYAGLELYASAT